MRPGQTAKASVHGKHKHAPYEVGFSGSPAASFRASPLSALDARSFSKSPTTCSSLPCPAWAMNEHFFIERWVVAVFESESDVRLLGGGFGWNFLLGPFFGGRAGLPC